MKKMKLLVEFELDESWDAYIPDNNEKLKNLIKPQLEGVKATVVENLNMYFVTNSEASVLLCKKCNKEPQLADELCNKCYYDEHKQN
jgi:hypothetical protein